MRYPNDFGNNTFENPSLVQEGQECSKGTCTSRFFHVILCNRRLTCYDSFETQVSHTESLFFQTTRNCVGKALVRVSFSDAGRSCRSGRDGQEERFRGFTTVSVVRVSDQLALLFPLAKIGAVLVWIVRFVGCVCSEMDNASTDFRDVYAVFVFEAAADRQEEIQTEDRWWSVCWLSLQMELSKGNPVILGHSQHVCSAQSVLASVLLLRIKIRSDMPTLLALELMKIVFMKCQLLVGANICQL